MGSFWIPSGIVWVALNSVINVLIRDRRGETQTHRGDGDVKTAPEIGDSLPQPRNSRRCQDLGATRRDPPLRPLEGAQLC